jgi:hypothetical protein
VPQDQRYEEVMEKRKYSSMHFKMSAFVRGKKSASGPGRFNPGKKSRYPPNGQKAVLSADTISMSVMSHKGRNTFMSCRNHVTDVFINPICLLFI